MEGAWRKVRKALGLHLRVHVSAAGGGNARRAPSGAGGCRRDAAVAVAAAAGESGPSTPVGALCRSKSGGRSSSSHSSKVRSRYERFFFLSLYELGLGVSIDKRKTPPVSMLGLIGDLGVVVISALRLVIWEFKCMRLVV